MKKVLMITWLVGFVITMIVFISCRKTGGSGYAERGEMYNNFVSGYNILIKEVPQMIKDYNNEITDTRIADGSSLRLSPLVNVNTELKKARTFYEEAIKTAPSSYEDLCTTAVQMIDSSDKIYESYNTTNDYIQRKDWMTDTDGKTIAAQRETFNSTVKDFNNATGKVDAALETIEIEMAEADLKNYEKDKDYSYWYRFADIEAKKLVKAVSKISSTDHEQYSAALKSFNTAVASFDSFVDSKGGSINQSFMSYSKILNSFANTAEAIEKDASAGDGKAFSVSYTKLITYYNSLVDLSTALRDLENAKMLR